MVDDDGAAYGAEEAELEEALIKEEAALAAEGEDLEMGGAEDTAGPAAAVEDDDDSDAGSEDLEAESSGSDEEIEEEEGEGEEDMEMGEDGEPKPAAAPTQNGQPVGEPPHGEVMVH